MRIKANVLYYACHTSSSAWVQCMQSGAGIEVRNDRIDKDAGYGCYSG